MKKAVSILRWVAVMLISLIGVITSYFIFPIAYLLRNIKLFRNKLLWIYYDDEDGYGFNVDWWVKNKPFNFWTAYQWCVLRNPCWNLQQSLKPLQDVKEYVSSKGYHTKDGNYDISVFDMCVLKYITNNNYSDNKGDYISLKHSIIGSMFVWYKIKNRLYWRYSLAKNLFKNIWIEIQIGTNDRRYTWRFKIKNKTIYK